MITVTLYTRHDCHLCEDTRADLEALQALVPHRLKLVDIDRDPQLQEKYGLAVPVVEAGPFTLRAPITRQDLQVMLSAAHDRERDLRRVETSPKLDEVRQGETWTVSDRINALLSGHYMALFNLIVAVYIGLAFLAPVLAYAGASAPAALLYRAYSLVCHQLGYRSFFVLGDQIIYPRAAAGVAGVASFQQATGLSESGDTKAVMAARNYIGEEAVGYKVALCERDIAIYGGILLFGLLFSLTGFRIKSIPWWLWLAVAIVPIGLDGFSQLLSQPPLNLFPFRESTPWLRVLTGFLFGFSTAWFGYPMVEESMVDSRRLLVAKRERLQRLTAGSRG